MKDNRCKNIQKTKAGYNTVQKRNHESSSWNSLKRI